jgi:hypothetical protein
VKNLSLSSAVLLAALTMSLTSCSRNPVAPDTSLPVQPGTSTTGILVEQDDPPTTDGGTPNSVTVPLLAGEEGKLTAGRWTVWVRKNSIKQGASIRLTVADPEALECQIEVTPASANDFQSPVIVTCDLNSVPSVDWANEWMFSWDGSWNAAADASAHPNQQNVVGHFTTLSNCQAGPKQTDKPNKGHKG